MLQILKHVFKQRSNWILHLAKLKHHPSPINKIINGINRQGFCIFFPDANILFFKPTGFEILIVDKSKQDYFEYCLFDCDIIENVLIFIDNLWNKQELHQIIQASNLYQTKSSKHQDFYHFDKQHIQSCLLEINKHKSKGMHHYAIIVAKEVYIKANDFVNKQERTFFKVKSLLIQSESFFALKQYYQSLKYILRCLKKCDNSRFSMQRRKTLDHLQVINSQLKLNYHLNYDLHQGKFHYHQNKISFHCLDIKLIKTNRYQSIQHKIKKLRFKRCQTCHIVSISTKNKKCSRCKLTFYCSKKCQKIDWKSHHKRICH